MTDALRKSAHGALVAGCAGDGSTSVAMGYGYGVYYGSAWVDDEWYDGRPIDVGQR